MIMEMGLALTRWPAGDTPEFQTFRIIPKLVLNQNNLSICLVWWYLFLFFVFVKAIDFCLCWFKKDSEYATFHIFCLSLESSSVRDLIHRPEDDDGEIEGTRNNSRFPRDNYRRRSRSRSPRHHHHRHRPYDNNRFNNNILVGSSNNFHGDWRNSIQRNQQQSRQQYYHQETRYGQSNTVQTNVYNDFQNIYAHQNSIIRCYRCGK